LKSALTESSRVRRVEAAAAGLGREATNIVELGRSSLASFMTLM
jgi:hypothetical protein